MALALLRRLTVQSSRDLHRVVWQRYASAVSSTSLDADSSHPEKKPSRWRLLKIARRQAPPPKRRSKYEFDRNVTYSLPDALQHVRKASWAHFDETLEVIFRLNLDPRKAEQNIRGMVHLPHGSGVYTRVAVFGYDDDVLDQARQAGADLVGNNEIVDEVVKTKGKCLSDFSVCVATPDILPLLSRRVGRILGPKGLMPNAKLGTITVHAPDCVKQLKKGFSAFRTDRAGNVRMRAGKLSFSDEMLTTNCLEIFRAILEARPETVKRKFMKKLHICSSMGPSVQIDLLLMMKMLRGL